MPLAVMCGHHYIMGCMGSKEAGARRQCPEGHPLKYKVVGKVFPQCRNCSKTVRMGDYMVCEECHY